uniref:Protein kinase domain-containing protein n=1 Tax=Hemiselmis tepida TaxID=464990 RepID=A0A7S0YXX7_9CRYP
MEAVMAHREAQKRKEEGAEAARTRENEEREAVEKARLEAMRMGEEEEEERLEATRRVAEAEATRRMTPVKGMLGADDGEDEEKRAEMERLAAEKQEALLIAKEEVARKRLMDEERKAAAERRAKEEKEEEERRAREEQEEKERKTREQLEAAEREEQERIAAEREAERVAAQREEERIAAEKRAEEDAKREAHERALAEAERIKQKAAEQLAKREEEERLAKLEDERMREEERQREEETKREEERQREEEEQMRREEEEERIRKEEQEKREIELAEIRRKEQEEEEQARLAQEEEKKRQEEEKTRQEEERVRMEEEERKRQEEDSRAAVEKAEAEQKRMEEEERRRRKEEERKMKEEEEKRRQQEEAKRRQEEIERKKREEEERTRQDERAKVQREFEAKAATEHKDLALPPLSAPAAPVTHLSPQPAHHPREAIRGLRHAEEGGGSSSLSAAESILQDALDVIEATDEDPEGDEAEASADAPDRGMDLSAWCAFCDRVAAGQVTPTCVMDFPYQDRVPGGLQLEGDAVLLERMFTFNDPMALGGAGAAAVKGARRVVVKVHTLLRWVDRQKVKKADRCLAATSVNVRHVTKKPGESRYEQEKGGKQIVPVSNQLIRGWRVLFLQGKGSQIEWRRDKEGDVPSLDAGAKDRYDAVRKVLALGETISGKAIDTFSLSQTMKNVRGGSEFEVVGLSEDLHPLPLVMAWGLAAAGEPETLVTVTDAARATIPAHVPDNKPICILFVGVNSKEMPEISVRQECELIRDTMRMTFGSDMWQQRVVVHDTDSSKLELGADLIDLIQKYKPGILHLAVHGEHDSLLVACDRFVQSHLLGKRIGAINRSGSLRLVVTNSCLSSGVAEELSKTVEFVIGHRDVLPDKSALGFSTRFYRQLSEGSSLEDSTYAASSTTYCLWANKSDPARMFFFPSGSAGGQLPSPSKEDKESQRIEALVKESNISDQLELAPFSVREWVDQGLGDEDDEEEDRVELGHGSYARTVRMRGKKDTPLEGNLFAVKVILTKTLKKFDMAEAVQQEIDILKGLKHRNIIRYWGDFSTKKEISIVMELAEGGSLAECLKISQGGMQGERAEGLALQMASGLSYMHDQGVYHRDMKPENVLLSSKGAVKIADFGLSKSVGTSGASAMGTTVGTHLYHSPQKVRHGQQYSGAKDDVWGMGCIVTELASGKRLTMPLWDDGPDIRREREERVEGARVCSTRLGDVAMGCLQLDEGTRISAMQAVVALKARSGPDPAA